MDISIDEFEERYLKPYFEALANHHKRVEAEYLLRHPEDQAQRDKGHLFAVDLDEWQAISRSIA